MNENNDGKGKKNRIIDENLKKKRLRFYKKSVRRTYYQFQINFSSIILNFYET